MNITVYVNPETNLYDRPFDFAWPNGTPVDPDTATHEEITDAYNDAYEAVINDSVYATISRWLTDHHIDSCLSVEICHGWDQTHADVWADPNDTADMQCLVDILDGALNDADDAFNAEDYPSDFLGADQALTYLEHRITALAETSAADDEQHAAAAGEDAAEQTIDDLRFDQPLPDSNGLDSLGTPLRPADAYGCGAPSCSGCYPYTYRCEDCGAPHPAPVPHGIPVTCEHCDHTDTNNAPTETTSVV